MIIFQTFDLKTYSLHNIIWRMSLFINHRKQNARRSTLYRKMRSLFSLCLHIRNNWESEKKKCIGCLSLVFLFLLFSVWRQENTNDNQCWWMCRHLKMKHKAWPIVFNSLTHSDRIFPFGNIFPFRGAAFLK
jgi:hypothetical protein